jgi:cytochrome c oxidase subunit 3
LNIIKELMDRSWETPGIPEDVPADGAIPATPSAKIGLGFFLAVVTTMFSLFTVAYIMRMEYADWRSLPDPGLLWLNTAVLILSSIAMQRAKGAALRGEVKGVRTGLITSGVLSFAFLAGQLVAWRHLNAAGYFIANNPANAFFYLITGLHGLHLLGGLWVWGKTITKVGRGLEVRDLSLSVELCTTYWHYLLLVWLVLFGLLLST